MRADEVYDYAGDAGKQARSSVPSRSSVRVVRVAIGADCEIVTGGLAAALQPYAGRVEVAGQGDGVRPDIVLQDPFPPPGVAEVADPVAPTLDGRARWVGFGWRTDPVSVRRVLDHGAAGYLSKALPGALLAQGLELVAAGHQICWDPTGADIPPTATSATVGLSDREVEVLGLVAEGLANLEIARRLYLSNNTIKTYIRTAYRKIGVTRRSQAVAWYLGQSSLTTNHALGGSQSAAGVLIPPPIS